MASWRQLKLTLTFLTRFLSETNFNFLCFENRKWIFNVNLRHLPFVFGVWDHKHALISFNKRLERRKNASNLRTQINVRSKALNAQFANKQSSVAIISSINDFSDNSRCLFSLSHVKRCNTTVGRGRLHVIHDDGFIPFSHFIDLGPSAKGNGRASFNAV